MHGGTLVVLGFELSTAFPLSQRPVFAYLQACPGRVEKRTSSNRLAAKRETVDLGPMRAPGSVGGDWRWKRWAGGMGYLARAKSVSAANCGVGVIFETECKVQTAMEW